MEILNRIIMTACICGTAVSICDMLCADGKYSKQIRLILSLVFVTGITAPITAMIKNSDISDAVSEAYSYSAYDRENADAYRKYLKRTVEANINDSFREMLANEGIKTKKICTEIDISEDYSISIIKTGIECDDFENASEIIKSRTGEEFEIWEMN